MFSPIKLAFCNSACPILDHPYSTLIIFCISWSSLGDPAGEPEDRVQGELQVRGAGEVPCQPGRHHAAARRGVLEVTNNYKFMHWRLPVNLQKGRFILEVKPAYTSQQINSHQKVFNQETSR